MLSVTGNFHFFETLDHVGICLYSISNVCNSKCGKIWKSMHCIVRELPEHMSSVQLYILGTTVFQWGIFC